MRITAAHYCVGRAARDFATHGAHISAAEGEYEFAPNASPFLLYAALVLVIAAPVAAQQTESRIVGTDH